MKEIIEKTKQELNKVVEFFTREIAKIRTGQASPSLVEDVMVEVSGQMMSLKQLAGISCPERRQILIQPWDKSYLEPIERALFKAQLGVTPIVDKDTVRVSLPSLTQEYRQDLIKTLNQKTEQAKQVMRKWREEAWSAIQGKAKDGAIREDEKFRGKDELQKLVDEYSAKVDTLKERKEKEVEL
ncbi:MAG: ribosome recycling factor [Candidatus Wildermuthbacteria bacterium]|nr:ribosome recycling factor [Candidatus Wildermuthbacteria bacterium]